MNIKTKLSLLVVAIGLVGPLSQVQLRAQEVFSRNGQSISVKLNLPYASDSFREAATAQDGSRRAVRGDIATGSVLAAPGGELRLNIQPCGGPPVVVIFHQPYSRSTRGQKNCGGQTVTIEQIQQN